MLTRQLYLQNISEKLAWLKSQIELINSINLYDLNIQSESFFQDLLNITFGYNLINLNMKKKNYSSIDLADESIKMAIQITSCNTSSKITKTIQGFIENKYYEKYNRLIIFILGSKKKYRTNFDTQGKFKFSKVDDIIDINDLICEIHKKDTLELHEISEFFNHEISSKPVQDHIKDTNEIIEEMQHRAKALCLSKLKSLGVSKETATQIIEKDISDCKYEYVLDAVEQGKNYLVGEFGSGKSHTILILAQRLMQNFLAGDYPIMPLFVQAHELILLGSIQKWTEQIGKGRKYIIFIDGLDEVDYEFSEKIVEEVEFLIELWPDSRIIIGSRPISIIPNNLCIQIQALNDSEKALLFSMVSGEVITQSKHAFLHLDEKFRNVLSKPFFCIIYALYKAEPRSWAKNDMDLVTVFIDRSLEKLKSKKKDVFLQLIHIAILSVNCNLGRVHITELGSHVIIDDVLKTGFVTLSFNGYFSFPLPIINQWLAAEGIRRKIITIDNILCDEINASRWIYSVSILFSQMSYEESRDMFANIVKKRPELTSMIIKDGIKFGYIEELPSAHNCGKMLRACMETLVDALGPLSNYIAPVGKNGLHNLAIDVGLSSLTTTWADREGENDIVELTLEEQMRWVSSTISRGVPMQSTWPWIVTFDYLSDRLKKIVDSHSILIENGLIEAEYIWKTTLILLGYGCFYKQVINISEVERYRQYIGHNFSINGKIVHCDIYFHLIDKLIRKGEKAIRVPYPVSDRPSPAGGGFVWSKYSNERMLDRIRFIYTNAMIEYKRIIELYFLKIKNRMSMYSLFPCKFVGYLNYNDSISGWEGHPSMMWYLETLPRGKSNEISIRYGAGSREDMQDLMPKIYHNIIKYRPLKREWIKASMHIERVKLSSATPVTDLVYEWLKDDLITIGWIKQ